MEVQVFGVRKSAATRSALRFFAERRVKVHFVDFAVRGPSRGELLRFAQLGGAKALIDSGSRRFAELGLGAAHHPEDRWLGLLLDEPLIIRMPLVRWQNRVTVGPAEATWKDWMDAE